MSRVKSAWMMEQEINQIEDSISLSQFVRELQAFREEFEEENNLAEEKADERERQRISIR